MIIATAARRDERYEFRTEGFWEGLYQEGDAVTAEIVLYQLRDASGGKVGPPFPLAQKGVTFGKGDDNLREAIRDMAGARIGGGQLWWHFTGRGPWDGQFLGVHVGKPEIIRPVVRAELVLAEEDAAGVWHPSPTDERFRSGRIATGRQPPVDPAWDDQRDRLRATGQPGSPQFVEVVRFLLADGVSGMLAGETVGRDAWRLFVAGIVAKSFAAPHAAVADNVVARAVEFVAWQADPSNSADPHGPRPDWWPKGY